MNKKTQSIIDEQILVVEDDRVLMQLMVDHLNRMGHAGHGVATWNAAKQYLDEHEPNLIIMDVRLPDKDGMKMLPKLSDQYPVIILTAYGSVQDAVKAIKAGASEYLTKPVDLDELEIIVKRSLENAALRRDYHFIKQRGQGSAGSVMIGNSVALKQTQKMIDMVAATDMTVLINGESGVGKELVAEAIHAHSARAQRNFIAVDCCTLQEKLFESELFGHERGSFTSADKQKKGLIEGAQGGTLFLDEIGEIEPSIQAKLLRVLETGQFRRVGGTKDLKVDVRIVAATNRDLEKRVQREKFRSDLFYRLNGFTIVVPPLRDRREDIPELVKFFIENHDFSRRIKKKLSSDTLQELIGYDWPGNIRELKNLIERAIIVSGKEKKIKPEHLGLGTKSTGNGSTTVLTFDQEPTLDTIEKKYLTQLLVKYNGHRVSVAQAMGVSERNLYRLINKHDLQDVSAAT